MPLNSETKTHIEAAIKHLADERDQKQQIVTALHTRIKELNSGIATLQSSLTPESSAYPPSFAPRPLRYENISVRWAILDLLHDSEKAMTTSEIAESLKAAGVQTRAANFTNNVSAVLSTTMKEKHKEVQQLPDSRWELTENGIQAIEHIRTTSKFRRSCGLW
ncbi:MAG TPA: hypothetical protein VKT33_01330 [Candidatus Angelobacter sp.]|nr:hypothetical protein [Candidatus Angelobacter sp.]